MSPQHDPSAKARMLPTLVVKCITAALACLSIPASMAQEPQRVRIIAADDLRFDDAYAPGTQRLTGSVRFGHGNAEMFCDSAWIHPDRKVDAYGRVRVVQGDSLELRGEQLHYEPDQRMATIRGNVHLRDKDMDLHCDALSYDLGRRTGRYVTGGRITSSKEDNTLTSMMGTYLATARTFIFSRDVVLTGPGRTIRSDTLHYLNATSTAEFHGPTVIEQDSTTIFCVRGWYDTRTGLASFWRRATIRSKGRELEGDSIRYDREQGLGRAWGNVEIIDTAQAMIVRGQVGRYSERTDDAMVTGRAELVMAMSGDSLFMHGDSLFAHTDTAGARTITARRHVRFFKSDMQGTCDTMVYATADSLIHLMGDPFLWTGEDQINGRTIRLLLSEGRPHRMFVEQDAFMMSQVDSVHFDQVAGTMITGRFEDGELRHIVAEGNCRSVYFARELKDGAERIIGVDLAEGSRIDIVLKDAEVNTITFHNRPDADLHPLDKAPADALRLEGSLWNAAQRPGDREDIFRR